MPNCGWRILAALAPVATAACAGPQSTFVTAGSGAGWTLQLFWWLLAGATLVWLAVTGLAVYAVRSRPERHSRRFAMGIIVIGGVVLPSVVLAGMLFYGLGMLSSLMAPGDGLVVRVTGERWWWRVSYLGPDQSPVIAANEIRLPVGSRVELLLDSPDVIHSFWIPSLGGKIDMIPGRVNRLVLEPTRVGVMRGVCAEYCGTAHALMAFPVTVMEADAFSEWLEHQASPALEPRAAAARRGAEAFLKQGCGACHRVAGTVAEGVVGPDLTHLGSRASLGAGTLPMSNEHLRRWIAQPGQVKPGVLMPGYPMLDEATLGDIAAYLAGLK